MITTTLFQQNLHCLKTIKCTQRELLFFHDFKCFNKTDENILFMRKMMKIRHFYLHQADKQENQHL